MVLGILTSLLVSASPKVGDAAPDFSAVDTDGQKLHLADMLKSGPVILAFFPKAFTGG